MSIGSITKPIMINGRRLDVIITKRVEVRVNGFRHVGEGDGEEEAIRDFERKVAPVMGTVKTLTVVGDKIEHPKPIQLGVVQRFGRD